MPINRDESEMTGYTRKWRSANSLDNTREPLLFAWSRNYS